MFQHSFIFLNEDKLRNLWYNEVEQSSEEDTNKNTERMK